MRWRPISSAAAPSRTSRSADHPRFAQRGYLGRVIAGLTQYLLAVLADFGRQAGRHLFFPPDLDRAVDGHVLGIVEANEMAGCERLLVVRDIVGFGDDAEDQPGVIEDAPPVGQVA